MTGEITAFVIIFGTLMFLFGLVSRKIAGTVITAQMIFVAAGILLSPAGLNLIKISPNSSLVLVIAEIALVLTFFSDASRIGLRTLLQSDWLSGRLLLIGLPLTIGLGTAVALIIFTDLSLIEAALLGAILAPTDAALGQKVVEERKVPVLVRQGLNVESGLNDGAVMPLFIFLLVLGTGEELNEPIGILFNIALGQIGLGILIGGAIGLAGGWLFGKAAVKGWMSEFYYRTGFVALALISWLMADEMGGSGFIAAFVAGLATGAIGREITEEEVILAKVEANTLSLAVLFIIGIVSGELLPLINLTVLTYAVLSLTIIRMLPVAISLIGTHLNIRTQLFVGWFGPRGLASIVLLLIAIGDVEGLVLSETIELAVITTVLISIFAHGITAGPASKHYSEIVNAMPSDAPEKKEVEELPTRQGTESGKSID
ncbi:cation:proton antiporter [Methanolobus sp. ZRKC2]|uniref:cation:proton antiporter n=1 Tax=Methanolobus sp. ZRKC2 TaxID=3125783 RepID=UPI003246351F